MFYLGYLIKVWTGKNIFENANKSLKKANGEANKLRKTLSSFDEMNVLQDSSSGGGGAATPSFDLSNLENIEVPQWLITIKNIGQWIIDNWQDVVFGLLLTKAFIDLVTGNWLGFLIDFIGMLIVAFFKLRDAINEVIQDSVVLWAMFTDWFSRKINNLVEKFNNFRDKVVGVFTTIRDKIKSIMQDIQDFLSKKFGKLGAVVGEVIGAAFKNVVNAVLKTIETVLNVPIKSVNSLINVINKVPGINIGKLSTFNLPRLASGGIVHNPGNGVFMGSYVAGEGRDAEAVIPLNDETLDRLGEAFARHTSINATIPVYAYNRQVAREIRKIEAEQSFAYNR